MINIQTYRRGVVWALALTYLLLPFLEIGGDSALRFDVSSLRLHFWGTALWVQEFYVVMLALLFSVLLFFFLTLVFGRVWCGWFCPQTIVCDLTDYVVKFRQSGLVAKGIVQLSLALIALIVGFVTVCYFVSPYEALPQLFAGELGSVATGCTLVIALLLYLHLVFLRRTFCSTICPYAKFQGAITDSKSLEICLDEKRRDDCLNCKRCLTACPTGLDIREGMQVSCIMCAACVDACRAVMGKKGKKSLILYRFGSLEKFSLSACSRPAVIALFLVVLVTFAMFFSQVFFRSTFDFNILPHPLTARQTKSGEVLNAYILSIKNMNKEEISLTLTVAGLPDEYGMTVSVTEPLLIPAGIAEKFPLFIRVSGAIVTDSKITFALQSSASPDQIVQKTAYFLIP